MYDEDWGQFIVIDDDKDPKDHYYYANPKSWLYPFSYFEILQKPIIIDMLLYCFKNLLYGNH